MNVFGLSNEFAEFRHNIDGDLSTDTIDFKQDLTTRHVRPQSSNTYDLGGPSQKFRTVYAQTLNVSDGVTVDSVLTEDIKADTLTLSTLTPSSIVQTDASSALVTVPTTTYLVPDSSTVDVKTKSITMSGQLLLDDDQKFVTGDYSITWKNDLDTGISNSWTRNLINIFCGGSLVTYHAADGCGHTGAFYLDSLTSDGVLKVQGQQVVLATSGTDYERPLTFSTGVTRTVDAIAVDTTQNISRLSNLSSNGLVKTTTSNGTLAVATSGTDYELPLTFSTGLTRTTNTVTVNASQNITRLSNLSVNGIIQTTLSNGTLAIATAGTDYEVPVTASTGLTRTVNAFSVNTTQNITRLSNLTSNGLVKTTTSNGTLATATAGTDYENPLTFSGASGLTRTVNAITISPGGVTNAMLAGSIVASNLAGSIPASKLVSSDITSLGTINSGTWNAGVIGPQWGGTGVSNAVGETITLGGAISTGGALTTAAAFTQAGAFATTLTSTGTTNVTLPTTGTLLTAAGAVTSLTGTANQITASASTGAVTLSTPQNIHTAATPTFASVTQSSSMGNVGGYPAFPCRAWGHLLYTGGTLSIVASGNISTAVRNGTGAFTITMTTGLQDTAYIVQAFAVGVSTGASYNTFCTQNNAATIGWDAAISASVFRIYTSNSGTAAAVDPYRIFFTVFR